MAINYTKIGWDTTKYVNPTNMNQMDDGIKAACDGVDNAVMLSSAGTQIIAAEDDTPISIKSNSTTRSWIQFRRNTNAALGKIGVGTGDLPLFRTSGGAEKEIALAENVVKLSSSSVQEITTTGTSAFPISIKGGYTGETLLRYRDGSGNTLGYIGVASGDTPVFYGSSGSETKEIALTTPTSLTTNTDLNNITNLGWYACPTGAVAATLANCPYTTNEFGLQVVPTNTGNGRMQMLYAHGGTELQVFIRRGNAGGTWYAWAKFTFVSV